MKNFKSQNQSDCRAAFGIFTFLLFSLLFSPKIFAQHLLLPADDYTIARDHFLSGATLKDNHSVIWPVVDFDLHDRVREAKADTSQGARESLADDLHEMDVYRIIPPKGTVDPGFVRGYRKVAIRPVYDLQAGKNFSSDRFLWNATGGVILDATIRQKIGIEARFVSGINVLSDYQDSIAKFSGTMPGYSDRAYALDTNGKYAFQHFSGNITWRPLKIFNLQVGRDKHFWGEGHRSLFLSDLSAAFPYVQQQTTIWRLQYTSLFAWLQDWTNSTGFAKDFRSKFATFHYIDFNAAKWLNLGVFESVVWQGTDSYRTRWFDPNYLNPMTFFRPVEYSLGSSDNAMLGFAMKIRFNANNVFYSQLILDEFYLKEVRNWKMGWWANKQGIQVGYKCFNFGQVENLFMQTEINIVRPYTYSHGSPQQNYANGGMPLAHPLGANFAEWLGILSYNYKGFTVTGELLAARYGLDQPGMNHGQNIFLSYMTRSPADPNVPSQIDYHHKLFDGLATNLFYAEFKTSYRFNTTFPLRVELTAGARSEHNVTMSKKSSYVLAGLVLPLYRTYRDF